MSRIDRLLSATNRYAVLDGFGNAMLDYRSWGRTKNGQVLPSGKKSECRFPDDHHWSKNDEDPATGKTWREAHPTFHPRRVVFGLPHNYGKPDNQKVNAGEHERRASPLFLHVHPVGKTFVGVGLDLRAKFLPDGEQINAGGVDVPANICWPIITNFLDGKVGNPPTAKDRFPGKKPVLP